MSVTKPNRDWNQLDERFAAKLRATVEQANRESRTPEGKPKLKGFVRWELFEGYRSQERQNYLYSLGRTREGRKVTWTLKSNHTGRMAGDVVWRDDKEEWRWDGSPALWAILGHCARANGLAWGGDWKSPKTDRPHIEWKEDKP